MSAAFGYDSLNRLNTATLPGGETAFNYDAASRLANVVLPNNITTTYSYDAANRMTGFAAANPGLPDEGYAARTFALNATGMITNFLGSGRIYCHI